MVREGELLETDTMSELGIFGAFLRRGDKVLMTNEAGHLNRTKDYRYLQRTSFGRFIMTIQWEAMSAYPVLERLALCVVIDAQPGVAHITVYQQELVVLKPPAGLPSCCHSCIYLLHDTAAKAGTLE